MGQEEILELLEKYGKPMSRTQIARTLSQDVIRVSHALTRLVKGKEVKIIEIDRFQAMKLYRSKRRMFLYYV